MQGVCEDVRGARSRGAACLLEGLGDNIQAVRCTGEYVLADTILAAHLTLENPFASHARVGLAFTQQQNLFEGAVRYRLLRVLRIHPIARASRRRRPSLNQLRNFFLRMRNKWPAPAPDGTPFPVSPSPGANVGEATGCSCRNGQTAGGAPGEQRVIWLHTGAPPGCMCVPNGTLQYSIVPDEASTIWLSSEVAQFASVRSTIRYVYVSPRIVPNQLLMDEGLLLSLSRTRQLHGRRRCVWWG